MNQNYLDVTIRIHVLTLLKWVKKKFGCYNCNSFSVMSYSDFRVPVIKVLFIRGCMSPRPQGGLLAPGWTGQLLCGDETGKSLKQAGFSCWLFYERRDWMW